MPVDFGGLPQPGGGKIEDPISVHHFGLDVQGIETALFSECSAIDNETEVISYSSTSNDGVGFKQQVPGNSKWGQITLKRGLTKDNKLFEWRMKVIEGDIDGARVTATLSGYDPASKIVMQYVLHRAWPCKYTGAAWDAKSPNTAAQEQLVIVHEGARRTK